MHERTSRAVARLLFVFCCAIPTLATVAVILATWTPWYERWFLDRLEQDLFLRTELAFKIDHMERPTPTSLRLRGIRVTNPETGDEVATVRVAQWAETEDLSAVVLHQPIIRSGQLGQAWKLLHNKLLCVGPTESKPLRFSADDLTIKGIGGDSTIQMIRASIVPEESSTVAEFGCKLATQSLEDQPFWVRAVRDRRGAAPLTRWELNTNGTVLPCSAVADYFPAIAALGSEATFDGYATWHQDDNGLTLSLNGSNFSAIDLSRVTERLPHRVTGMGTVQVIDLKIIDDVMQVFDGSISAEKGRIDATMIEPLQTYFGFISAREARGENGRDLRYDSLRLHVNATEQALTLHGTCGTHPLNEHLNIPPGAVTCLGDAGQLFTPNPRPLPITLIAQLLKTEYAEMMPISRESFGLLRFIQPPSRRLPGSNVLPVSARIGSLGGPSGGPYLQPAE